MHAPNTIVRRLSEPHPDAAPLPLHDAAAALMQNHWRTSLNSTWHTRMAEAIAAEVPDLMQRVAAGDDNLVGIARRMGEALIERARLMKLGEEVARLEQPVTLGTVTGDVAEKCQAEIDEDNGLVVDNDHDGLG